MKTKLVLVSFLLVLIATPVMAGYLLVNSNEGASVYINGSYVGNTPLNLTLKNGTYKVLVVSGSYKFLRAVKLNKTTNVSVPIPAKVFRVAPIVRIRPVNDVVTKDKPGLVEFYFSNPTINDVPLTVDVYVSVPSGVHVSGEGFSVGSAAGTIHGHFVVPPGSDRTVYMNVVGEKIGKYLIHVEVIYYPGTKKNDYQQISLTHPFDIKEPTQNIVKGLSHPISLNWIIFTAVVLGGIAIIFGMVRRPPKIEIEEK